jgi:hypothetical protein
VISRLGLALILIGTIAMIVYLVTESGGQGDVRTLLGGALLAALGLWLRLRAARARVVRAERFRLLRRTDRADEHLDIE